MKLTTSKAYPWIVVGLLWVVALLNYMDRQMLSTMREAMQIDIAELESAVNFGRLMAIFLWIYGCISPFAGAIADRISRKWLIIGSLAVWSGVTLAMGFCTTYSQIYVLRAIMGISEALYIPAGLSLIADYFTGSSRSLAVGIHMTGLYLGQAVGGFGATIAAAFSWQQTFLCFGIVGVAYAALLCILLEDRRSERLNNGAEDNAAMEACDSAAEAATAQKLATEPLWKSFALIFSRISFWTILFFFATSSLPGWSTKNWLPTLFAESLGIPMSQAGPLSTITIAVSSFFGVLIGGSLSDRWVRKNLRGRIYTSAIGLALMIPALVFIGLGSGLVSAIGAGVCFGVGYGMFDTNNMPILCQFVSSRHRATAYGIMNMTGVFFGALITQVLGRWADQGNLGVGFALMAAALGIALLLQLTVLRPTTDNME
ncbi:MAG: MFS transporter [Candidatus Cryptobacteroides sp.]